MRSGSMTFEPETAAEVTPRKRFWTKKKVVASVIAGAVLIPGAAWAAVNIFGLGAFGAATPTNPVLTIDDTTYPTEVTPVLAPGQDAGVKIAVKNGNGFPVTVNSLIVKNGSVVYGAGQTESQCDVTVTGTSVNFPNADGSDSGSNGRETALGTGVSLAPGEVKYVTFPGVFQQANTATKICTVGATFAVKGTAGS